LSNPSLAPTTKPAFLADEMVGRLAKWLRLLGYDTSYVKGIKDDIILDLAEAQGRIILTRDTLLIRRKRCRRYIFIRSDFWREQLKQVYIEAGLSTDAVLTICPRCNCRLQSEANESLKSLVPPYVYSSQNSFSRCPCCARIYWAATHVQSILDELNALHKEP
jgi:hypothetical protein